MRISYGHTRFVVVVGSSAYKIGRIRVLRFILKLPSLLLSGKHRVHFFSKYGDTVGKAVFQDILAGPIANRTEYGYWQKSHDHRVVPVKSIFFWGLVVVQERAERVSRRRFEVSSPFRDKHVPRTSTFRKYKQFGRHNGAIKLVDFGRPQTCAELWRTLHR